MAKAPRILLALSARLKSCPFKANKSRSPDRVFPQPVKPVPFKALRIQVPKHPGLAAGPDMTIVAQMTIDDNGNLPEGTETEEFTRRLDEWPADVIGVNCSVGPKTRSETVERMMEFSSKPVSAMPNAGVPVRVEGRNLYLCSPEYMAQYARRLLWAGVRIVGGCCGTTPEHIKLIHAEARSLQPIQKKLGVTVEEPKAKAQAMPKVPVAEKSQ